MNLFYSKTTGGFYNSALHAAGAMPADARAITQAQYTALLAAQQAGQSIGVDGAGAPVAVNFEPSPAQLWAAYQSSAQAALSRSDITVLRCYEAAVPLPAAWAAYRVALRAIVGAASGDPTQPLPVQPAYPTTG